MAMEKLKEAVEKAVMDELQRANASFPLFNSKHEGYAVIKEELEETRKPWTPWNHPLPFFGKMCGKNRFRHLSRILIQRRICTPRR